MSTPLDRLAAALEDQYRIERELGAGGMATVYLAEDLKHQRKVAIKVLRPDLAMTLGPDRFVTEIRTTANLQHPHILPLYDSGEAGGFLYYVMPYVEGPTLRDRLTRERELPVAEAARILRDVADAMASAHAKGVVHRDLKPENVMLSGRHAMVADFGVAKAVSEATGRQRMTTEGVALGTPTYMAPEQAAADPLTDHRADIYALGILAYEMLTGQPPFVRATGQALLAAHVTEAPVVVTERRPSIPPALSALIMKCLEKKPADRWQHADELLPILEGLATPSGGLTPTGMQPVTVAARPVAGPRRRALLGVAAVAVLAAVGAGAWALLNRGGPALDPRIREPVVVLPFEVRGGDASLGVDAAERITAGIQQAGLGEVVRLASAGEGERFTERLGRSVLRETEAATLVIGTIVQRGEGVEVQASVVRGSDLKTIWTLGPEIGQAPNPTPALDAIRERVLGAVGWYLSPAMEGSKNPGIYQPPTSLEVLRRALRANELFLAGPQSQAIPILQEAFALDTTYLAAPLVLSVIYSNTNRWQQRDSVLAFLEERRARLYRGDALALSFGQAGLSSPEQEYRAAMDLFAADSSQAYLAMYSSVRALYADEALRYFGLRDTTTAWGRNWQAWDYQAGLAYHMLGRYEEELALARAAKAREPRAYGHYEREVRALAALGRTDEIEQVLTESRALEWVGAGTGLLRSACLEFSYHGHDAEARAYAERTLAAVDQLPAEFRAQLWAREAVRTSLRTLGRHAENSRLIEQEARIYDIGGLIARVVLETSRARAGDTVGALALVDTLRTAPTEELLRGTAFGTRGWPLMRGAQLLALLGRKDESVNLLREALNYGARIEQDAAVSPSWAPIKDYPPFQELVKLKDGS